MKTTAYISFIYSLIVIVGGVMSYRFANSVLSLFVEVFFGIIIFVNVFFMIREKKFSFYVVLVLSLLLAMFYGYNFSQTNQFFQGLMTGISIFVAAYEFLKIVKNFGSE